MESQRQLTIDEWVASSRRFRRELAKRLGLPMLKGTNIPYKKPLIRIV